MSAPTAVRKVRPSWNEILEWHEHFDGEPEITASAKRRWRAGGYDVTPAELERIRGRYR